MTEPFATWIERDVVTLTGPDAGSFLQGQLSQDVEDLPVGASTWSLLLQPSGKVDAWLRVTRTGEAAFELDVDGGFGDAVAARLQRFKLRTACDIEVSTVRPFLAVRGVAVDDPGARPIVWPGTSGADLPGDAGSAREVAPPAGVGVERAEVYERARIQAGVPAMGRELTAQTIPVEAGQWLIDASVSFTKGCYTGQELVARIESRGGQAPRPVRGLRVEGAARAGDRVVADGVEVGTLTSVSGLDDGTTVALAPLPRAVRIGAEVDVGGRRGTVVALPMT